MLETCTKTIRLVPYGWSFVRKSPRLRVPTTEYSISDRYIISNIIDRNSPFFSRFLSFSLVFSVLGSLRVAVFHVNELSRPWLSPRNNQPLIQLSSRRIVRTRKSAHHGLLLCRIFAFYETKRVDVRFRWPRTCLESANMLDIVRNVPTEGDNTGKISD